MNHTLFPFRRLLIHSFLLLFVFLFTAVSLQAQSPPDGEMSVSRTSPDTFTLGINTGALWEYGLEATDDLTLPWTTLNTEFLAGDGGRHSLRVILPPGAPRAFFRYRIRERAAGASGDVLADWDRIYFFNATVWGDLDGDGFADTLETALGTNQNDALSYPWRVVRTVPYAGEEGHARDEAVLLYLNQPLALSVAEVPANFVRELYYVGDTALDFALNAPGSTVILPGRKVVAFLPSPALLEGSDHTLLDNYRVDFSTATTGLAQLAPWHAHFSTVDRFDTVGPWVKQVLPGETAIEVAGDFVPVIEWSQPLQPATVAAANVSVVNETTGLPHAVDVVFDYDTNRISLTHAAPFDADTVYKVTLGEGFSNLMSKPLLHPHVWSFRTRPATVLPVAGQGPYVAAISPAPYSVDAGVGPIAITFSEPMDAATLGAANMHLREYGSASDVEGVFAYDAQAQVLSFSPLADLSYATRYELTLDGAAIFSAATPQQPLQAQTSFVFTTAPAPGSGTPGGTADANAGTPDPEQKPPLQLAISYGDPEGHASATVRLEMTLPDGSQRQAQLPNATKQWRTELSPKVPDGTTVIVVPSHVRDGDTTYYTNGSGSDYPYFPEVEVGAASPTTAGIGYFVTRNYTNASSVLLGTLLAGPFMMQVANGDTATVAPAIPATTGGFVAPRIVPDEGVAGVVGDIITSNKGANGEKHFVSPKKSTEIPQDFVTLKAESTTATALTAEEFESQFEWEGGIEVPGEPLKRRVSRGGAGKTEVKIKLKAGAVIVDKMNVWVVWADITSEVKLLLTKQAATHTSTTGGYDFTHTIQPAGITDLTAEIPNLRGDYTIKPPNVPAGDISVFQQGVDLSKGADHRWDTTRRMRQKLINPSNINFAANHPAKNYNSYLNYPSERLVGNDDTHASEETNDPYSGLGKLKSTDSPALVPLNIEGSDGDTFELRVHWEEFTRLQIGSKWYIISNPYPWRLHFKFKKVGGVWEDNWSDLATDNAGF